MTVPKSDPAIKSESISTQQVFVQEGFEWDAHPAYLFDIDGTLLRSGDGVHYNAFFSSVRDVLGHELSLEGVVIHGNTDPGILQDAFRRASLDEAQWQPLFHQILENMRSGVASRRAEMKVQVMPGVPETLEYLHSKNALLAVATGNLEAIGWLKIELAGLRKWFSLGGFSDGYAVRAEMIGHAAELARAIAGPDASVCVVGDTPFDISAARANSLPVIAVATGRYSFDELMESAPDACATTLEDLLAVTRERATSAA